MKLFVFIFFSLIGLITDLNEKSHDFHLSKCDIIYSTEEKAFQISLQLFIDDLEIALAAEGHENLGICTPNESDKAETIIHEYIAKHLSLNIDGNSLKLSWVGKEVSDDLAGIWCYLEVYPKEPQKDIGVYNDLLVEIFSDQRNIVKLTFTPDQKAYFLFDEKEMEGILNISE